MSEEDLIQMIFIKVFQNIDGYAGKVPLQHWISRIAVNTCLNALRAEKRRPEWRLADFDEESSATIEQLARAEPDLASADDARAARQLLNRMLTQLAPEDRLLVTLLHLEERSVEEIHLLTGWSRSVIKVRAFRARAKMKKMLEKTDLEAVAFAR
jgi:RNA polymerase sigma-70 factor (ECF subfamily)